MDWIMMRYGWVNVVPLAAIGALPFALLVATALA